MTHRPGRWLAPAALALSATLALTACGGTSSSSSTSGAASRLKIGMVAALSGVYQSIGTDMRDGFQLYLDQHNGQLGGHPIDLVVADEGAGAATAAPAATKLIKQDKVLALTGLVGGDSVAAVAPLTTAAKIPLLGSNARPGLKDFGMVWTTSFGSLDPGQAIAKYVLEHANGPVYAIGPDYQGGWDELKGFTDAYAALGGKLANPTGKTVWTPFPTTTNFLPYLSDIAASGAKAIYTFYAGGAAIAFVKQWAQSDAKNIPLYGAGFLTEGGVLGAEGTAANGVFTVLNYSPDLDNSTNRAFVAGWRAKHDGPPTTYAMASYDAAAILDKAIAGIKGTVTPDAINSQIAALGQIDSPRGQWQFNAQHAPVQKWYLRKVGTDGRALSNLLIQDLNTIG